MGYLFFNADREFDDGEGNEVPLGRHLDYVLEGGSPDCWDTFEGTRNAAIAEAKMSNLPLYVVDDCSFRVVAKVNMEDYEE
jgi:hypothetical protein